MSIYASRHFWEATAERAIKTTAQVTGGLLTADHIVGVLDVEWAQVGSVAALAALLSVLTSIASAQIGKGGPSLGGEIVESDVVEWADGREVVAGPANDIVGEGAVVRELTPEPSPELVRHGDEEVVVSEGYVGEHRAD